LLIKYLLRLHQCFPISSDAKHGVPGHTLSLFDPQQVTMKALGRRAYLAADRWRNVTGATGLVFDCRDRPDVDMLRALGRWAIDPLDCANPEQYATFEDYVVGYFAKDDGQILKIKPSARAHTLIMGQ
jgi:hypothetical protein